MRAFVGLPIPRDTKGWSVVCVCDISWSHLLVYVKLINDIRSF